MSLVDEPRLYENQNSEGPLGSEQRLRVALKSGLGPLTGKNVVSGTRSVSGSVETYIFYSDVDKTAEVARVNITYSDSTLSDFVGWVWELP